MTHVDEPDPATARRRLRRAAAAGMAAPVVFVAVFTIDGWRRDDYDPVGMFVSELSLGAYGWVQIVNFLVTGALVVVFGHGLSSRSSSAPISRAGVVLVQIIGIGLVASGPFTTDPSTLFGQVSVHGIVHGVFGAVVFSLAPISCFVFYRRFRSDPAWRPSRDGRWLPASRWSSVSSCSSSANSPRAGCSPRRASFSEPSWSRSSPGSSPSPPACGSARAE
jgi:Protein of unknown function (DUF998)